MSGEKTPVGARDESLPNSDLGTIDDEATMIADKDAKCLWNGAEFADGSAVCAEGVTYACHLGNWMKMPGSC